MRRYLPKIGGLPISSEKRAFRKTARELRKRILQFLPSRWKWRAVLAHTMQPRRRRSMRQPRQKRWKPWSWALWRYRTNTDWMTAECRQFRDTTAIRWAFLLLNSTKRHRRHTAPGVSVIFVYWRGRACSLFRMIYAVLFMSWVKNIPARKRRSVEKNERVPEGSPKSAVGAK